MNIVEIRRKLHMILPEFGQAYVWQDGSSLTLVDTGIAGGADDIAAAIVKLGFQTRDVRQVVLTHFHDDHAGAAAEIASWGDVTVLAHRLEAPIIRGEVQGQPPSFTDEERALHERIGAHLLPPASPCRVDRELLDGDVIDFGGGARVIATPGHTDGSIAIYLPKTGVLFTGDTVAHVDGQVMPGVFNIDRARMLESFRSLAQIDASLACVGHGDPIVGDVAAKLSTAAAKATP